MTSRPAVVEACDVSARVAGREVIREASLQAMAGEPLALLGPNGAGKSTLLALLGLRLAPMSGRIVLDGRRVDDLRGAALLGARRQMACVFQKPLLLDRSVRFNVELGLAIRGVPARQRAERSQQAMAILGIEGLAERRATRLSGGEAQRASIARALAIEPRLLLLDELFTGLDGASRRQLVSEMIDLVRQDDVATVLVTHDHNEARALSTRVAVIDEGRVVQSGATLDVLANPGSERIAELLGFENAIDAEVVSSAPGAVDVRIEGGRGLRLSEAPGSGPLRLFFRAEHLRLRWSDEGTAVNTFPARIRRIVPEGFPSRIELEASVLLRSIVPTRLLERRGLRVGDEVLVEVAPEAIRAFSR